MFKHDQMMFASDVIKRTISYSVANHLDFGDVPAELPQLEPIEEMLIARVHVSVNIYSIHNPPIVILRPSGPDSTAEMTR